MIDRNSFHLTIQRFYIFDMKFRSCLCLVAPAFKMESEAMESVRGFWNFPGHYFFT